MSQENVEIMREGYRAFSNGEVDRFLALVDPDIEWKSVEDTEPKRGVDGVIESVGDWFRVWEELHIEQEELIDAGDHVIAVVNERGRLAGIEGEVSERFFQVWTLRDGKIVSFREYKTRREAVEAVGLSE
jgi:ketosteroid isomerase-like protein